VILCDDSLIFFVDDGLLKIDQSNITVYKDVGLNKHHMNEFDYNFKITHSTMSI
jgi:hypothetical protein